MDFFFLLLHFPTFPYLINLLDSEHCKICNLTFWTYSGFALTSLNYLEFLVHQRLKIFFGSAQSNLQFRSKHVLLEGMVSSNVFFWKFHKNLENSTKIFQFIWTELMLQDLCKFSGLPQNFMLLMQQNQGRGAQNKFLTLFRCLCMQHGILASSCTFISFMLMLSSFHFSGSFTETPSICMFL